MPNTPNVLLVGIDTQVDFMMPWGRLPVPGADALVLPGIKYLAEVDPNEVKAALFTFDTHKADEYIGSLENLGQPEAGVPGFPLHCELNTPGWGNVFNLEMLAHLIPVFTLNKSVFDMWEQDGHKVRINPWRTQLQDEGGFSSDRNWFFGDKTGGGHNLEGIDTIRIFGVASDFCVNWAINGFLKHGYKIEVIEHLTAGIADDIRQTVAKNYPDQVSFI